MWRSVHGASGPTAAKLADAHVKVVPGRAFLAKDHHFHERTCVGEKRIGRNLDSNDQAPPAAASRYEPLDVPPMLPFWLGALIAGFVILVLVAIAISFPLADRQQSRGPLQPLPPAPRLQTAPVRELQRYEAAKRQELAGKGATVPIDAAMQATAQQGWGPPR